MARRPRVMTEETKFHMNLVKLVEEFGSDDKCRQYLEELRWPDGVSCPRCNGSTISRIQARGQLECAGCRYQFSVTSRNTFHDTHLPLWKWFLAVYLLCESKKGMSANQVKRTINVSYKTAWYLCHRIRHAMDQAQAGELLTGTVEVDETFVGGRRRHVGSGYVGNKTIAAGVIQRGGDVRLQVVPNRESKTLRAFIEQRVSDSAVAIYTDEHPSYRGIGDGDTVHETVNHSIEEWVRGNVHTNSAESVWSLLERSIIGAFHHVSGKHLDRYLDELEWRFNNRQNAFLFRDTLMQLLLSDNLSYAELTADA